MWIPSKLGIVILIFAVGIQLVNTLAIICPDDIIKYADVGEISTSISTGPDPITSADTTQVVSTHDFPHTFYVGTSIVIYVAQDDNGGSEICEFTVTILRDDIPLATNCPSDQTVSSDPGSDSTALTWTPPTFLDDTGMLVPTASHNPGDTFFLGDTQVVYEATDVTNNTGVCMFTVTIQDTEEPTFTGCPAPLSAKALLGTTVSMSWTPPTANDNSGLAVTTTSSHDPGDSFAIGNTAVNYAAVDEAGNVAFCTFAVIIEETTGPVWNNCPPPEVVNNDPGEATAVVSWTEPTAVDADGVPTTTSTNNPGDTFDVGVTLVTYMATDGDGFMASCAFAITVEDNENPVISNCPLAISTKALATNIPVQLYWLPPTASDNIATNDLLVSTHNPGDAFPSGQTQVNYVATDNAGNQAACVFTIDVQEVDPADTSSYNGTLGLDRIGSVDGPFTSSNTLLSQDLINQLDSVLRSSSISDNYVGIDSITASLNSNGIAVLEYTLYVLPDAGYGIAVIEESFEENLNGADENEFMSGNRVVNASFVLGICPIDFCDNDGLCFLDKDNFVSVCQCPSGYTGSQCQSRVILSQTLIIIISVTSGLFLIVVILLVICCILTLGNDYQHKKETDLEKFPITGAEKANGNKIQNGNIKKGVPNGVVPFYPNGVNTISGNYIQNGNPPKFTDGPQFGQNPTPKTLPQPQPRLIPINPSSTYVPSYPPPTYQNGRTQNPSPIDDPSGPRFQHKTPDRILRHMANGNRYVTDGNYRYVLDDRSRVVPLRRTRSYGDDLLLYDDDHHEDHRRRRKKRHRKRRTRSLGHQVVFTVPAEDISRLKRRKRRRHRARRTTSLRLFTANSGVAGGGRVVPPYPSVKFEPLPADKYRVPARDYSFPREVTQHFIQHHEGQRQSGVDSSDNSRDRSRQLDHLNLETAQLRTQPQTLSNRSHSTISTTQPIEEEVLPPPPNFPPPPPPTPPPPPPPV